MCAMFTNLHDVAQVLSEHIRELTGVADVQPGPPRDAAAAGSDAASRITLLYLTTQPAHVNDPVVSGPAGTVTAPPLSLSCFYLITTSGVDQDDPIAAHYALGRILTLYHDVTTLDLPLTQSGPAGVFTELGDGPLHVTQVPMSLDQIDKVRIPAGVALQPWALFEVWPVQLRSEIPIQPAAPPVRPGGIGLDVKVLARPQVVRICPEVTRTGGRVRIEASLPGDLDAVAVDSVQVASGDASLTREDNASGPVLLLTLDDGGLETLAAGSHRLTLRSRGFVSPGSTLTIAEPGAPVVDALAATSHNVTNSLVLTGAGLDQAKEAILWPDLGVAAPDQVHVLALQAHSAGEATIAAAGLAAVAGSPGGRGPWRCALRVGTAGADVFTPYVLVELIP